MPGLDPGIHLAAALDCRVEPGNDNQARATTTVKAEIESAAAEIRASLALLRRHL
jgi:hypothetical protein